MSVSVVDVRAGRYFDSITLMQLSRKIAELAGVERAHVAMATPLNVQLLHEMGFEVPATATPDDLVVAVHGLSSDHVRAAVRELDVNLQYQHHSPQSFGHPEASKSVRGAVKQNRAANFALVAVPGPHAFFEAVEALSEGLSVLVFSDNVPIREEVRLKTIAGEHGLLAMGPDCGTAILNGAGIGFANVVAPGPVGLVSASGTGAQQVMCLLDHANVGITHVLGVGSRDLSKEVAARATLNAISILDADPRIQVVGVLSKTPDSSSVEAVTKAATHISKPVLCSWIGDRSHDLTTFAEMLIDAVGGSRTTWPAGTAVVDETPRRGYVHGHFVGGSLCTEALSIFSESGAAIGSNVRLPGVTAIDPQDDWSGHLFIDFGDDQLTLGRAHPMIDQTLRLERLTRDVADDSVAVILLDVVLGRGASTDPATELEPVVRKAVTSGKSVVVTLCGSRNDPQDREAQASILISAGASVYLSNAQAARRARTLVMNP